jgi:hypothetical protein
MLSKINKLGGLHMKRLAVILSSIVVSSASLALASSPQDKCVANIKEAAEKLATLNLLDPLPSNTSVEQKGSAFEVTTVNSTGTRIGTITVKLSSDRTLCLIYSITEEDAR